MITTQQKWFKIFKDLKENGKEYSPRGFKTLEIENYVFELDPIKDKLCSFKERKISLKYLFAEYFWFLSGDRDNEMIEQYAPFWKTVKNKQSPFYNSNYGYYFFIEKQYDYVIETLLRDQDSRQATILLNRKEVMMSDATDKICTNSISFRIRDGKLNMSVTMRSNDLIFGTTVDVFQFGLLYEMIYNELKNFYSWLEVGVYNHKADSFHIYERHFKMLDDIVNSNGENWIDINVPNMESVDEVKLILNDNRKVAIYNNDQKHQYKFYSFCIDTFKS